MSKDKKQLRKEFLQIRNSIDEKVRLLQSSEITDKIIKLEYYKNAEAVFLYISVGSEVCTKTLADKILADKKRLIVPKCNIKDHTMELYEIRTYSQLCIGAYNIPEPKEECVKSGEIPSVSIDEIDLAVVPGLSFDKRGMRLGYGGGYYDRFLKDYTGKSVGLLFLQCMTEELPADEFDCAVDIVIYPEEMI